VNKRRLFILSFSIVCIVIITAGFVYWAYGQWTEQKLQGYIRRLKDEGFTTEEHSLADFDVDGVVKIHFFSDFRSFARQEDIDPIYFDKRIHALYFLRPILGDGIEANIFYYKWKLMISMYEPLAVY